MHELAIAESVIAIASEHAGDRRVTKVVVRIGHLRQVVPSALAFAFELAADGTLVEGAVLEAEEVPVTVRCGICGRESRPAEFPLACRDCGSPDIEVTGGEELYVDSLELEEALATGA